MKFRWRALLPLYGLLLFGVGTYASIRVNRDLPNDDGRYFWWSALRLDTDPLNRHSSSRTSIPYANNTENCAALEPLGTWVDPGLLAKCFVLTTLPAWLANVAIVYRLARLGVSELTSFFVSMPLLTLVWFYFVGWSFDRWQSKRVRT